MHLVPFPPPPHATIVFEGDSQTNRRMRPSLDNWAFLRLSNWDRSYADIVAEWVFCVKPELQWHFHNAGVGGSNVRDIDARYAEMVAPWKPALIILTIGNNDPHQGVGLDEFQKHLTNYTVRAAGDFGARILYLGLQHGDVLDRPEANDHRQPGLSYQNAARDIVLANGGIFIDGGQALERKGRELRAQHPLHTIYSDGSHLNAVGIHILASEILHALGALLP